MLQPNPRRADAGHPTIPMHRPEVPRFAPTTPPPDEALMLGPAAEFRHRSLTACSVHHPGIIPPPPFGRGLVMRPTVWQGAHRGVTRRWNIGGIFVAGARESHRRRSARLLGWFPQGLDSVVQPEPPSNTRRVMRWPSHAHRPRTRPQPVRETSSLATKFNIPRTRPDLLGRSRLIQRLDQGMARELMLVCTPAGLRQDHPAGRLGRRREAGRSPGCRWTEDDNDPVRLLAVRGRGA